MAWITIFSTSADEEKESHLFRVLPLGNHPPFRQEVRDGVRYELDPPAGSVPPAKVEVVTGEPDGVESDGKLLPFRLRLGSPSPVRLIKVGETRSIGLIEDDGGPWTRLPMARGPRTLAVAWRGADTDWRAPKLIALTDGPEAVAPGTVRVRARRHI